MLSYAVAGLTLGSEARLAPLGAQCPPEGGHPQDQFLSERKSKKTGEGKKATWTLELLTPCCDGCPHGSFPILRVKAPSLGMCSVAGEHAQVLPPEPGTG